MLIFLFFLANSQETVDFNIEDKNELPNESTFFEAKKLYSYDL
jgi:hypothetical protein